VRSRPEDVFRRRFSNSASFRAERWIERVHYMLEEAFVSWPGWARTEHWFSAAAESKRTTFETNPIYAILQSPATLNQRVALGRGARSSRDTRVRMFAGSTSVFTGEMIYPWMFRRYTRIFHL